MEIFILTSFGTGILWFGYICWVNKENNTPAIFRYDQKLERRISLIGKVKFDTDKLSPAFDSKTDYKFNKDIKQLLSTIKKVNEKIDDIAKKESKKGLSDLRKKWKYSFFTTIFVGLLYGLVIIFHTPINNYIEFTFDNPSLVKNIASAVFLVTGCVFVAWRAIFIPNKIIKKTIKEIEAQKKNLSNSILY